MIKSEELNELNSLINKMKTKNYNSSDLERFRYLLKQLDPFSETYINQVLQEANFQSLQQLEDEINNKKAQEAVSALVMIGLTFLAAYFLSKSK